MQTLPHLDESVRGLGLVPDDARPIQTGDATLQAMACQMMLVLVQPPDRPRVASVHVQRLQPCAQKRLFGSSVA